MRDSAVCITQAKIEYAFIARLPWTCMLTIIGDINVDLLMASAELPREGGDALAHTVTWSSGGTGINSAVAVAADEGTAGAVVGARRQRSCRDPRTRHGADGAGVDLQDIQHDPHIPTGLCVIPVTIGVSAPF
jgi:sugar/nucleoside kinase (ribokinase family)